MAGKTLAEALSEENQRRLKKAQELGMCCERCGQPIVMFCCGWTFPVSFADRKKVQEALYGEARVQKVHLRS